MHWQALPAMFLGLVPFLLLPAIFAFMNRKRHRFRILGINVLLFAFIVAGFAIQGAPLLGTLGSVVSWLLVLGWSLRRDPLPAEALDEAVTLAPYDSRWPDAFETERRRVCAALELEPAAIEHIGSTAVPGMLAKPIVDLMLGVSPYPPADTLASRLVILGYQDLGEAGVAGRRYLKLREQTSFNLHIVQRAGEHWTNNLRLRDFLRGARNGGPPAGIFGRQTTGSR